MPEGAEYVGAGMTGVVFCTTTRAYKIARRNTMTLRRMLQAHGEKQR